MMMIRYDKPSLWSFIPKIGNLKGVVCSLLDLSDAKEELLERQRSPGHWLQLRTASASFKRPH